MTSLPGRLSAVTSSGPNRVMNCRRLEHPKDDGENCGNSPLMRLPRAAPVTMPFGDSPISRTTKAMIEWVESLSIVPPRRKANGTDSRRELSRATGSSRQSTGNGWARFPTHLTCRVQCILMEGDARELGGHAHGDFRSAFRSEERRVGE